MKTTYITDVLKAEINWELSNAGGRVPKEIMETFEQQMELYIRGAMEELKSDIEILSKFPPMISDFAALKIKHNLAKEAKVTNKLTKGLKSILDDDDDENILGGKGDDFPF